MAGRHKIEWTEETWNPVTGCTKVSLGCKYCYAERLFPKVYPGRDFSDVLFHEDRLHKPFRWRKPRLVFVNSMSDLFHESLDDDTLDRILAVMALTPRHTYQILTKRAERMREYLNAPGRRSDVMLAAAIVAFDEYTKHGRSLPQGACWGNESGFPAVTCSFGWPLPNVWWGASAEDHETFKQRYEHLQHVHAAVRWLSLEPLLGPINLRRALPECECGDMRHHHPDDGPCVFNRRRDLARCFQDCKQFRPMWPAVDWVVVGGESGPGSRPIKPILVRSLRDQCVTGGVPFFFKQWGGLTSKSGGRDLDGRTWDEMPRAREAAA